MCLNKYRIRTSDKVWNAPTKEEEKIIALEAKIEQMTKAKEKPAQGKTNSNTKRRGKRDKEKGGNNSRKAYVKPAWMLIAPKSGESGKKRPLMARNTGGAPSTRRGAVIQQMSAKARTLSIRMLRPMREQMPTPVIATQTTLGYNSLRLWPT
jgi:hypothetical protein